MPYSRNADLPPSVQHVLPEHAQDIYRTAFNRAWQQHMNAEDFDEATVDRIAWGAVKREYAKVAGDWVRRVFVFE